jgi:hypothetical protein
MSPFVFVWIIAVLAVNGLYTLFCENSSARNVRKD